MNSYLIADTSKEERKEIVKKALAITLTGCKMPSQELLDLAKEYIDGKTELSDIQNKVLEKYKNKGDNS